MMTKKEKQIYEEVVEEQPYCMMADEKCSGHLEIHHVFRGKNRKNSTKYKMLARLCDYHHDHMTLEQDLKLKKKYQEKFMNEYPDEDFLSIFRRNYL